MSKPRGREPVRLAVTDFGPIAKADVDLRPLTVFIGPSNTGKSYLAILIYALHSLFPTAMFRIRDHMALWWKRAMPAPDAVMRLAQWINKVSWDVGSPSPGEIVSGFRPILEDASAGDALREEIVRCFGVGPRADRLIRSGSSRSAKIVLRKDRFDLTCPLRDAATRIPLLSRTTHHCRQPMM